jgi:ADP-L-glycero-D-manno-heptose 6-epimerase
MIAITGAAGFIGSCLAGHLNEQGHKNLLLVDDFLSRPDKARNYRDLAYIARYQRLDFPAMLERFHRDISFVIHMGARTDTTEKDWGIFEELNLGYSKKIWELCAEHEIPLIYASSAATYGGGELGYDDRHDIVEQLQPLNPYGISKNDFDIWALKQEKAPPFWAGLKFFNVYGPNEFHKGRMASVIFHAVNQIRETGKMKLFRSHRPDVADGHQSRDFIYVKDVENIVSFLMTKQAPNGLYNVGTGKARTFLDLTRATFRAMGIEPNIEFMDTPEDIRDTYQYFTEANMDKLRAAGYDKPFWSLEDGVEDYVRKYLL